MKINIENAKERFKNHVAKFTDCGNIKILDFENPGYEEYRIRFLFEEDHYRLHISGDLGELIASNYKNMTWECFGDFVHNPGYFEQKINTHSRPLYVYDDDLAKKQLEERLEDYDFIPDLFCDTEEEKREEVIDEILSDFDDRTGIGARGYDKLSEYDPDCWEYVSDIGKERTGILELYMLAFKLARAQLADMAGNVEIIEGGTE